MSGQVNAGGSSGRESWREYRAGHRKTIKVIREWRGWIVCQELVEAIVHWPGKRTIPCGEFLGQGLCDMCALEIPIKKQVWLLVQDERGRSRPTLFNPTLGAVEGCPRLWELNGDLWGTHVVATRIGNPAMGRMKLVLSRPEGVPPIVARPVDVLPALQKLWAGGQHLGDNQ